MTAVWARTMRPTGHRRRQPHPLSAPPRGRRSPGRPTGRRIAGEPNSFFSPRGNSRAALLPATRGAAVVETDIHSLFLNLTAQADALELESRGLSSLQGTSSSLASSCKTRMVRGGGQARYWNEETVRVGGVINAFTETFKEETHLAAGRYAGVSRLARPDATKKGAQHE
jgi:hypothetical protein